jgi:hypothetical protein
VCISCDIPKIKIRRKKKLSRKRKLERGDWWLGRPLATGG